jgi:tetratricopeptide (TPR) repeat protein
MKLQLLLFVLFLVFARNFSFAQQAGGLDWFTKAEEKRKKALYQAAIEDYKIAIIREPDNFRYHYAKALAEYSFKKSNDALLSLQKVISLERSYAPAYALSGRIYHETKNYEKAYKMYDAAATLEKDVKESINHKRYVIDFLVSRGHYQAAYDKIAEIFDFVPSDLSLVLLHQVVCNNLKRYGDVIELHKKTETKLTSLPQNEASAHYFEAGFALYFLGQYDDAFKVWEKITANQFKNRFEVYLPIYLEKCALAYADLEEYEEAMFFIEKLKKINPDNSVIYFILGKTEIHKLDFSAALKNYLLAARFEKDFARSVFIYRRIAEIELEMGNFKNSLEAAEKGLSLSPKDENLLFVRAHALYKLQRYEHAIEALLRLTEGGKDELTKSKYWLLAAKSAIALKDLKRAKLFLNSVTQGNYKTAANYEIRLLNKEAQ